MAPEEVESGPTGPLQFDAEVFNFILLICLTLNWVFYLYKLVGYSIPVI